MKLTRQLVVGFGYLVDVTDGTVRSATETAVFIFKEL